MKPRTFLDWTPDPPDLSKHFQYPTDNELVIVIPVWSAAAGVTAAPGERYLRQAFWMAKFILESTDASDVGVGICIAVSDTLWDEAWQMAGVSGCQGQLISYDYRPELSHFSQKFLPLVHPCISEYKRILHMDTCFQFGTHPTQRVLPCFERMLEGLGNAQPSWDHGAFAIVGDPMKPRHWKHSMQSSLQGFDGEDDEFWSKLAQVTGRGDAKWQEQFWTLSIGQYWMTGAMWGISRSTLESEEFQMVFSELATMKGMWDESIILAYMLKQRMGTSSIANIETAFWWADFENPEVVPYAPKPIMYVPWDSKVSQEEWLRRHHG